MLRVFLSYSHDDEVHRSRVNELADRLRADQALELVLDQDVGAGGPNEGWPAWSARQFREADRVLLVCSRVYADRYEGIADESVHGRGTALEARAVQQFLYEAKGRNDRFRVVIFNDNDAAFIPLELRAYHWFNPLKDSGFRELVEWLDASKASAPEESSEVSLWPEQDSEFQPLLADRRPHFNAVRSALCGRSPNRVLLFCGEGNVGKTQFLNEIASYADRIGVAWTRFDFKGTPPIENLFEAAVMDLGTDDLPRTRDKGEEARLGDLVADLRRLNRPALFMFDTYEKASPAAKAWIENQFLPRVRTLPGVIVVIGGRNVPDHTQYQWRKLTGVQALEPIRDVEDWLQYLQLVLKATLDPDEVLTLVAASQGVPGILRSLLENLVNDRAGDQTA